MTRREKIVKATKECREDYVGLGRHLTPNDIADAFEEGAEWMQKKIIDKACSILEDMTEGRLGKRFISEFKNKLKDGVLERH